MYRARALEKAEDALAKLPKAVARRIAKRIHWLAENLDNVKPEALAGNLAGLFKFRVGDYRVIYEPLLEEEILVIHAVGHRKDVYRME